MIRWPIEIVEDIARRRSVLFLGSGISANSLSFDGTQNPPTWEDFLRKALTLVGGDITFVEKLLAEKDYLTACEIIVDRITNLQFERVAKECFLMPKYQTHNIHKAILKLDSRIVATPNVDKIYEVFAQSETAGTTLVKNYYDTDIANKIRSSDRIIIKVHGTLDQSNKMIFTRKQYTNARYEYSAFYKIIDALALTHTFIFLGCGFSDPDTKLLLENYAFTFPNSHPHYMVTPDNAVNEDLIKVMKENCNINIITYNPINHHEELCNSLDELVVQVEDYRSELTRSMNW